MGLIGSLVLYAKLSDDYLTQLNSLCDPSPSLSEGKESFIILEVNLSCYKYLEDQSEGIEKSENPTANSGCHSY